MKAFTASKPRSAASREPPANSSSATTHTHSESTISFDFESIAIHPVVQAKPRVSGPEDLDEKEADAIADDVVSEEGVVMFTDPNRNGSATARADDDDDEIRRAANDNARVEASDNLRTRLSSRRDGGKPIPPHTRAAMESAIGASFANVRIFDDRDAASLAQSLHARAFTYGRDIYFAPGQYDPGTVTGKHLLAHELVHVAQQSGSASTLRRKKQTPPDEIVSRFTVTVHEPMSGYEFFVRAVMQYYDESRDDAEKRILKKRITCDDHPVCQNGVTEELVDKPIGVTIAIRRMTGSEKAKAASHTRQLSKLPSDERNAINSEADRRFWNKTEYKRNQTLGKEAGEEGMRQTWLRVREEVLEDGRRVESIPAKLKDFLAPKGTKIEPADYKAVLRIASKLETFTPEEWALYRRRVTSSTIDYEVLEKSIERFRAQQTGEKSTIERIRGTEALYAEVKSFEDLRRQMFTPSRTSDTLPYDYPGNAERYDSAKASLAAALDAAHFASAEEYADACRDFLDLFRKRAAEIALLVLSESEKVIRAERKRYDSREENAQLFEQLSPMRTVLSPSSQETLRSLPSGIQRTLETAEPSKLQSDDMGDLGPELAKAQSKRAKVAETHPILRDPELRTSALLADDADELGEVLRENADDRLSDIHKTRANVLDKRDFVFKLDRVKALAQGELGVTAGTVYESIINDHEKSLKFAQLIIGIATGALAIGLGVVSFGTGTVAVVAGAGSLALSIAGAAEAVETYSAESAAAHTSFDEALTLSSDDPSAVWVVLALIGVGFDGAALVNAAKSVLPAAKLLATASDIGKFESELAKLTSLSDAVKESLVRAGRAEAEYRTAVQDMTTAMLRESNRLYTTPFPVDVLTKMVKAAYYAAKKNITDFEVFLRDLRAQKFARDIDFDQLSAAQMRQLEAAFRTGTEQVAAEAKPFSMTLKYSKGDKTLTVDDGGRLLLDGKPISATKLNTEVIPKLRIEHALEGHGPDRNVSDVMKEALTNGPSYASGKFNSMQTMLESLQKARAEFEATFDAANTTRRVTKEIDVTPEVGRVFVRSDKVPSGIDKTVPFNAPEGVSELVATKVRAVFEPNGDLVTIYPIGL